MRIFLTLLTATLAMLIVSLPAEARTKRHYRHYSPPQRIHIDAPIKVYANPNWQPQLQPQAEPMRVKTREARHYTRRIHHTRVAYSHGGNSDGLSVASYEGRTVIGGRPSGCPHAYCGCALARHLGLHDARLNLAANWARLFPRTSASPGAVAVRSHHVMQLVSHAGGNNWVVRDYNGGRGLSYIHTRNVAGFTFVSPHSTKLAAL